MRQNTHLFISHPDRSLNPGFNGSPDGRRRGGLHVKLRVPHNGVPNLIFGPARGTLGAAEGKRIVVLSRKRTGAIEDYIARLGAHWKVTPDAEKKPKKKK